MSSSANDKDEEQSSSFSMSDQMSSSDEKEKEVQSAEKAKKVPSSDDPALELSCVDDFPDGTAAETARFVVVKTAFGRAGVAGGTADENGRYGAVIGLFDKKALLLVCATEQRPFDFLRELKIGDLVEVCVRAFLDDFVGARLRQNLVTLELLADEEMTKITTCQIATKKTLPVHIPAFENIFKLKVFEAKPAKDKDGKDLVVLKLIDDRGNSTNLAVFHESLRHEIIGIAPNDWLTFGAINWKPKHNRARTTYEFDATSFGHKSILIISKTEPCDDEETKEEEEKKEEEKEITVLEFDEISSAKELDFSLPYRVRGHIFKHYNVDGKHVVHLVSDGENKMEVTVKNNPPIVGSLVVVTEHLHVSGQGIVSMTASKLVEEQGHRNEFLKKFTPLKRRI